jgi:DNA ligase-1
MRSGPTPSTRALAGPALLLGLLLGLLRVQPAACGEAAGAAPVPAGAVDPNPDPAGGAARAAPVAPPALALAEVYQSGAGDSNVDLSSYLFSEKLDGVRAYWDGARLITRGGHAINAPDWFTAGLPPLPLDGELWLGRGRFAEVSGAVRRLQPEPAVWRRMRYMVFDLPGVGGSFETRLLALQRLVGTSANPRLALVRQQAIIDHTDLMARLEQVVAAGGEGLMLHRRNAPYRAGRGDDLLKVKPYEEGDARVIAHLPGRGKYEGLLGALLVGLPNGRRFRIGTGFSDAERAAPPALGSTVTFKYHGRTKTGLPRFASFLRVAEDL